MEKSTYKPVGLAVIATCLLLSPCIYASARGYMRTRQRHDFVARLRAPAADVPGLLRELEPLDADTRQLILDDASKPVIHYFEANAEEAIDSSRARYEFGAALKEIDEASLYYPDSGELAVEHLSIVERKNTYASKATAPDKPVCR
ncbi:MAG TPA: hypothetical protein VFK21_00620 [Gammaproteobacteria bacterium]|nr:hypothetical protein [Gammaproteobacteria bacterium]